MRSSSVSNLKFNCKRLAFGIFLLVISLVIFSCFCSLTPICAARSFCFMKYGLLGRFVLRGQFLSLSIILYTNLGPKSNFCRLKFSFRETLFARARSYFIHNLFFTKTYPRHYLFTKLLSFIYDFFVNKLLCFYYLFINLLIVI